MAPRRCAFEKKQGDKRNFWRGLWSEDSQQHHGNGRFLKENHCPTQTGLPELAKGPCAPNAV